MLPCCRNPSQLFVACFVACCVDAAAVAGLADCDSASLQTLAAPHADYHQQVCVQQVVLRPLWNAAVVAYQHLDDEEGLYEAWRWMEAHAQDWVPLQQPCYIAMLLAVTALHHRPMQGVSCTLAPVALHAIQTCSALMSVTLLYGILFLLLLGKT